MKDDRTGKEEIVTSFQVTEEALLHEVGEAILAGIDQPPPFAHGEVLVRQSPFIIPELRVLPTSMALKRVEDMPVVEVEATGTGVEVEVHL